MSTADPVMLSESAATRVKQLIADQGNADLKLRVSVSGGGCSGFQYGFAFDEKAADGDTVIEAYDVTLLIDSMSLLYLFGSTVDFVEDMVGASFQVKNPQAQSTCGCGSSFSI